MGRQDQGITAKQRRGSLTVAKHYQIGIIVDKQKAAGIPQNVCCFRTIRIIQDIKTKPCVIPTRANLNKFVKGFYHSVHMMHILHILYVLNRPMTLAIDMQSHFRGQLRASRQDPSRLHPHYSMTCIETQHQLQ